MKLFTSVKVKRSIFLKGVLLFLLLCNVNIIIAQKSANYKPYGCLDKMEILNSVEFEYNKIKTLSSESSQNKGQGLQFAYQFTTNLTPDNSGTWETKENGDKVWYMEISSPGAYTINLIFDRYKLPEGSKLFIYNEDMSDVIGAFTSANNNDRGMLATAPVTGDKVIVEYQEPKNVSFHGELMVGAVNHDYLGINSIGYSLKSGFGDSGSCEEDISCYDADEEIDIRRGVVRIIINGTTACSATLINNTSEDGTPYVITAAHCFESDETANSSLIYFNYESPHCSSDIIEGTRTLTLSGANMVVYAEDLDIALIEMNDSPEESYRPYYVGWSLNSSPSAPYYCIHHPEADVKKISISETTVSASTFNVAGNYPYAQVDDVHWKVPTWSSGVTEGGSSGSALFDSDYRLIGTLSGGDAYCGYPYNDYFTRFYKDWDLRSTSSEQFKNWLDPNDTGVDYLDGYDPYESKGIVRISNVEVDESPAKTLYSDGGYMSGHNSLTIDEYAEVFSGIESATLKGIYISPSVSNVSSDQTIDIEVWEGTSVPTTLVYTESGVSMSDLIKNREAYVPFSQDVDVTGTFYVGYKIDYSSATIDSFAVYQSASDAVKLNNTMMVNTGDNWQYASELYDIGETSLWIDLLAQSVNYLGTDTDNVEYTYKDVYLQPNPVVQDADIVYLNTRSNYVSECSIYRLDGSLVQTVSVNKNGEKVSLPISKLGKGTFLFKFTFEDGSVVVKRLVKLI